MRKHIRTAASSLERDIRDFARFVQASWEDDTERYSLLDGYFRGDMNDSLGSLFIEWVDDLRPESSAYYNGMGQMTDLGEAVFDEVYSKLDESIYFTLNKLRIRL